MRCPVSTSRDFAWKSPWSRFLPCSTSRPSLAQAASGTELVPCTHRRPRDLATSQSTWKSAATVVTDVKVEATNSSCGLLSPIFRFIRRRSTSAMLWDATSPGFTSGDQAYRLSHWPNTPTEKRPPVLALRVNQDPRQISSISSIDDPSIIVLALNGEVRQCDSGKTKCVFRKQQIHRLEPGSAYSPRPP